MANIYVTGVARSGKTTLCKLIKKEISNDYNYISFEALRNGFIKTQPELKMSNRKSIARKKIMPQFIMEFSKWNSSITKYPSLVDYAFDDVKFLKDNINSDDIIICLGFGNMTSDRVIKNIVEFSQEGDYSYGLSEEDLYRKFYDLSETDHKNKKECKKLNINYYNTSTNREKVLKTIIKDIKFQLNNEELECI